MEVENSQQPSSSTTETCSAKSEKSNTTVSDKNILSAECAGAHGKATTAATDGASAAKQSTDDDTENNDPSQPQDTNPDLKLVFLIVRISNVKHTFL